MKNERSLKRDEKLKKLKTNKKIENEWKKIRMN